MENLKCKSHKGKKINTICLDKDCKNIRLCCLLCIQKFHTLHVDKLVQVDEINAFIKQESKQQVQNKQSCSFGQKQVINSLEQLKILIGNLKKIILERLDDLQNKILDQIRIIQSQNLQDHLKMTNQNQLGLQYWKILLEGIVKYVVVDNGHIYQKKSKEEELNQTEKQQMKLVKTTKDTLYSMIYRINPNQMIIYIPNQFKQLSFSQNRKNVSIVLIDECTIKQTDYISEAIAFGSEGFDPSKQSYSFAFNIQNIPLVGYGYVFVGIGNDERLKASSYMFFHYDKLGHGQYMIYSRGPEAIHHTDREISWIKKKGMTFKTGDKIYIRYDHVSRHLEFRKQSDQLTIVIMPITDMSKRLYPCAMLYYSGSQVQLVGY